MFTPPNLCACNPHIVKPQNIYEIDVQKKLSKRIRRIYHGK